MSEQIGFIGLGLMGRPMARNLVAKGYRVRVFSRSLGPVDELVAAGATAPATVRELAQQSSVVITMLPDTPDVERMIAGEGGLLDGLTPGSLVIDMSSISPVATRRLAEQVKARGGTMLDAPVSGGEIGAVQGTLSIMVGGETAAFERARPILACMGHPDRITHVGPAAGSGQLCKICNQVAIAGALAGVAEALGLASKAGVDPWQVRQALLGGFAASRVLEVHGERMLTGNYVPGFRANLYQKDLRLAGEAAAAYGVAMPATALVTQLVNALLTAGRGDLDCAAVGTVFFELSGVDLPVTKP